MKFRTKALGLALLCALSQNAFSEQLDVWIRASNDSKVIYQKLADQFQKENRLWRLSYRLPCLAKLA